MIKFCITIDDDLLIDDLFIDDLFIDDGLFLRASALQGSWVGWRWCDFNRRILISYFSESWFAPSGILIFYWKMADSIIKMADFIIKQGEALDPELRVACALSALELAEISE